MRYDVKGVEIEARAGSEVLLTAGAVQFPQLLEVSGIGALAVLKQHGLEVQHELLGVGENYRDHYAARVAWRVKLNAITLNDTTRGLNVFKEALKYACTNCGRVSWTAGIGHEFVKT